jgi:hypothetical protein
VRLPDLRFSDYFEDQNHQHNVDEGDVLDAVFDRRIHVSKAYRRDDRMRRRILAKTDSDYITVVCEEAEEFWWVLCAFPSDDKDARRARELGIGEEL